jgi:hypothetical protein
MAFLFAVNGFPFYLSLISIVKSDQEVFMMKFKSALLFSLLIPAALFAQTQQKDSTKELQRLGVADAQIAQVLDIQNKTEATVKADMAQIRILQAQIEQALLPSASVDLKAVNGLIDQAAQIRADMAKAVVAARVQVRQLLGDDTAQAYEGYLMRHWREGRKMRPFGDTWNGMRGPGMMGSNNPQADGNPPRQ